MTNYTEYNPDNPDAIKAEIERTRNQMSNKIDTLQDRLHPDNIKHQAQEALHNVIQESTDSIKGYLQDHTIEIRDTVIDSFKQNPVPTVLVGIGLGWILFESLSGRAKGSSNRGEWAGARGEYRYSGAQGDRDEMGRVYGGYRPEGQQDYSRSGSSGSFRSEYGGAAEASNGHTQTVGDRVQELNGTVKETANQAVEWIQDTAGQMANQVSHKTQQIGQQAAHISEQTGSQMQQAGQQAYHILEENPLAVGAAALALGAVIGLLLPATRHENQMVGNLRDQLVEKGKAVAGDVAQHVQAVVEEVKPEIQQMAGRVVEELKPEVEQFGQKVVGDLKQAGEQVLNAATGSSENSSENKVASNTATWGGQG